MWRSIARDLPPLSALMEMHVDLTEALSRCEAASTKYNTWPASFGRNCQPPRVRSHTRRGLTASALSRMSLASRGVLGGQSDEHDYVPIRNHHGLYKLSRGSNRRQGVVFAPAPSNALGICAKRACSLLMQAAVTVDDVHIR